MTTYDYQLRITTLDDQGRTQPPESTLRALESYIGAMLTASGIPGAVNIGRDRPCAVCGMPCIPAQHGEDDE